MKLVLIGRPQFIGLPFEMGLPRGDQLQGNDSMKLIETAGRCCYDSFGVGRNSADYAQHIIESGHGSVLEHAVYNFYIEDVSRGLTHELVRHRVGVAYSQRSTRFVDETQSPWILHPLFQKYLVDNPQSDLAAMWEQSVESCRRTYEAMVNTLQSYCIDKGIEKLTARKQARGASRGILGNALETKLVFSANVRSAREVINQRASPGADAEIRELGIGLFHIFHQELMAYFNDYDVKLSPDGLGYVAVPKHRKV